MDNLTGVACTFLTIVVPIWLVLHFRHKRLMLRQPSQQDSTSYDQLSQTAARMENRIAVLERILDAEVPGWRYSANANAGGQTSGRV